MPDLTDPEFDSQISHNDSKVLTTEITDRLLQVPLNSSLSILNACNPNHNLEHCEIRWLSGQVVCLWSNRPKSSIPSQVKRMAQKLVVVSSLIDAQHLKNSVKNKPTRLMKVSPEKELNEFFLPQSDRQVDGNSSVSSFRPVPKMFNLGTVNKIKQTINQKSTNVI